MLLHFFDESSMNALCSSGRYMNNAEKLLSNHFISSKSNANAQHFFAIHITTLISQNSKLSQRGVCNA